MLKLVTTMARDKTRELKEERVDKTREVKAVYHNNK